KSSWSRRYWPLDILQQVFDRFRGALLRELDGIVNLRADFRFDAFQIGIFQESPFPEARLEKHDGIAFLPLFDFENVHSVHGIRSQAVGASLAADIRLGLVALDGGAHRIKVVLAEKNDRK